MRYWLMLAAALLLSGCYESKDLLLDAGQARHPVATSRDWTSGSGDHRYHARLTPKPNGWYDYAEARMDKNGEGPWKSRTLMLNALPNASGAEVYVFATFSRDEQAYVYGLVVMDTAGSWRTITPNCDPAADGKWYRGDRAAARAAGAELRAADEVPDICQFRSREALFQAMRAIVEAPGFRDRVAAART